MRAIRLVEIGRPLEEMEIPVPPVGGGDVLVRIRAAGICHSDAHYRDGVSSVGTLPQTLGHEIAGVIEKVGENVTTRAVGQRVCLHYLVTCGSCAYCRASNEPFCEDGFMLGKDVDGGYAEYISVPARNAVPLPEDVAFEHGAVSMCSSATVFHALRKGRLRAGERVAVYGTGGLGMSAIQLARLFGALDVFAVDVREERLDVASTYGATPIDASSEDPVAQIRDRTGGRGVDVSLALVGLPQPMRQAIQSLAPLGRAVLVGLTDQALCIDPYREILGKEAEIVGCSDHLLDELPVLIEFVRTGRLDLSRVVTETIPLEASSVNRAIERLCRFGEGIRTVITP